MQTRSGKRIWLILACGFVSILALVLFALTSKAPSTISVNVGGHTNDLQGKRVILICWSNQSSSRFQTWYRTQVFTNGTWQRAGAQPPEAGYISDLAPHSGLSKWVPTPPSGGKWRVEITTQRYPGRLERPLCWIYGRFHKEYPFTKRFSTYTAQIE